MESKGRKKERKRENTERERERERESSIIAIKECVVKCKWVHCR